MKVKRVRFLNYNDSTIYYINCPNNPMIHKNKTTKEVETVVNFVFVIFIRLLYLYHITTLNIYLFSFFLCHRLVKRYIIYFYKLEVVLSTYS